MVLRMCGGFVWFSVVEALQKNVNFYQFHQCVIKGEG